ncbi:MAG: tetratricopeptide repeat protein, partial [Candidatus Hydrogenedentota bacterium]
FNAAKKYFQKAIKIKPSHANAHFNLALLYEKQGDRSSAIKHYKEALRYYRRPNRFQYEALKRLRRLQKTAP